MKNGVAGVGIVGCGKISQTHLKQMADADVVPVAFCDIDASLAEARRAEFADDAARVYTDYDAMLADEAVDIVTISTPPMLHLSQTVAALRAGKWVYSEKPVAPHLADFRQIFDAERESGRRAFFTTSRFRARDGILMKEYVDEGALGEVYRVDVKHLRGRGRPGIEFQPQTRWFLDRSKAITGISGDMGMYFMDKAFHLTGWPEVTSVSAQVYKQFPHDLPKDVPYDVEEHMVFLARTAGPLTFTFEFANISHGAYVNSVQLLGTKGSLSGTIKMEDVQLRRERGIGRTVIERPAFKDDTSGDTLAYRALARAVAGEKIDLGTTSEEAYRLHQVLHMAFQSARERREITPDDVDESAEIFPGL